MRPHVQTVVDDLHVLARLAPFKPVVIKGCECGGRGLHPTF
jgi:hypothetical protein